MSKFVTAIPVKIKEALDALPAESYIGMIGYDRDRSAVEIYWENDDFLSGRTVPVEFPLDALRRKKTPEGTRHVPRKKLPVPELATKEHKD